MKPFMLVAACAVGMALALICSPVQAVNKQEQKVRQVWLRLKSGPILNGSLVKMDVETIDFTVKGILQSVPCDDLIGVMFVPPNVKTTPTPIPTSTPTVYPMTAALKPKILHKEPASYTYKAREEKIQGRVILEVVFHESGRITDIKAIQELPHGLTAQAIGTAHMVRFIPAMKDGKHVSVRGTLEYSFNLY